MLEQIIRELEGLLPSLEADLGQVQNSRELEEVRLAYLGKKGRLTAILKSFGGLSPEERPLAGKAANEVKDRTADLFEKCSAVLRESEIGALLSNETVDITMPGTAGLPGRRHPVAHVLHEIEDIFTSMGFDIEVGPDIEDDYHNFEALNIPFNHPARDMHDTFYIKGGLLLRTHTSPVQIRTMKRKKPPVAFIAPGK
ncbi:MAG TPA: phenylalanine--tRNA ligase subunit alpha, partial [Candidatus Sumerlaeota bacterium]|nr:phenylalanine--tRNA ligase subunit alpha [Candidatus Sumerlaeota bacterium]